MQIKHWCSNEWKEKWMVWIKMDILRNNETSSRSLGRKLDFVLFRWGWSATFSKPLVFVWISSAQIKINYLGVLSQSNYCHWCHWVLSSARCPQMGTELIIYWPFIDHSLIIPSCWCWGAFLRPGRCWLIPRKLAEGFPQELHTSHIHHIPSSKDIGWKKRKKNGICI